MGLLGNNSNKGFSLDREKPSDYSSDIFSNLKYEDLKKAHTETVIPVTKEDFDKKQKFNNLENYKTYRSQQNTNPLSLEQSKKYLQERDTKNNENDTRRIFNILKRDEEIISANKKWWGTLKQLQ